MDDSPGSVERGLGVDVPVDLTGLLQMAVECAPVSEVGDGAMECELVVGLCQFLENAPPEVVGQHLDRGEEAVASGLPRAGLDVEPAIGHQAMQVRMPFHLLVPAVQHRGATDAGAEAPGIGADGAQRLGSDAEQDIEHLLAVLHGDAGDRPWQGEDEMEVWHRQDASRLLFPPLAGGGALAAGTMAIPARFPDRVLVPARGAFEHGPTESRCPAALDTVHHLQRHGVEGAGTAGSRPGVAEDRRHAGLVCTHRLHGVGEPGKRMVKSSEHGAGGAGVDPRRRNRLVPKHILYDTDRCPAFMQMSANCVTQAMEGDAAIEPGSVAAPIEGPAQAVGGDGTVRAVVEKQPVGGVRDGGPPVVSQRGEDRIG